MSFVEMACNGCWVPMQSMGVLLPCLHVFCKKCYEGNIVQSLLCPVCQGGIGKSELVIEFQIINCPIPETDLRDIKGGLVTVLISNGPDSLGHFVRKMERLEIIQSDVRNQLLQSQVQTCEREKRQRDESFNSERLKLIQQIEVMETRMKQLQQHNEDANANISKLNDALVDRTRQMNNWKHMYNNLKDGREGAASSTSEFRPKTYWNSCGSSSGLRFSGLHSPMADKPECPQSPIVHSKTSALLSKSSADDQLRTPESRQPRIVQSSVYRDVRYNTAGTRGHEPASPYPRSSFSGGGNVNMKLYRSHSGSVSSLPRNTGPLPPNGQHFMPHHFTANSNADRRQSTASMS